MKSRSQMYKRDISESVIASVKDDDKLRALQEVMEYSNFFDNLDESFKKSGKDKNTFTIVIKSNFMVFLTKKDPSSYTDPELIDFLVGKLLERGYTRICVVESQNVLGKWYTNRDVKTVALACGYKSKNYTLIDLTLDAIPHKFNGQLGQHYIGKTWKEADYRISFAKNKTHPANKYTLATKNVFGVTTCENKYYEYHKLREWDTTTIDILKEFPVQFGFIDAFISADGAFGFRGDKTPEYTKTIIGGNNILAVDWVGSLKMGLDPLGSVLMKKMVEEYGRPVFTLYGNDEPYEDWDNIPFMLDKFDDAVEESYCTHSFLTHLIMFEPDTIFKEKCSDFFKKTRQILGLI